MPTSSAIFVASAVTSVAPSVRIPRRNSSVRAGEGASGSLFAIPGSALYVSCADWEKRKKCAPSDWTELTAVSSPVPVNGEASRNVNDWGAGKRTLRNTAAHADALVELRLKAPACRK